MGLPLSPPIRSEWSPKVPKKPKDGQKRYKNEVGHTAITGL